MCKLTLLSSSFLQDSGEVRRSALHVIINCVCAPIHRQERVVLSAARQLSSSLASTPRSSNSNAVTSTPTLDPSQSADATAATARKKQTTQKTAEDLINKVHF